MDEPRHVDASDPGSTPRFLGEYRILGTLGRGGMGTVYEAEQREPRRRVALKVVHGGALLDEETLALFRREIKALARLGHPGIAALYTAGTTADGVPFFAMERVDGVPLDAWGHLDPKDGLTREELDRRLDVVLKACDAVAHAHARGVIHRDLKPSNVLVREHEGVVEVKVLDFGLARIVEAEGPPLSRVTEYGTLRGTVRYMSPEQLLGDPDAVDARSDVYALGVLLYELLTGTHPHAAEEIGSFELPAKILQEPPRPISRSGKKRRAIDSDLATIVMRCLEREPHRRYPTVQALADDLRRFCAGQPIAARPPSAAYQLRKMIERNRLGAAIALTTAAALLLATIGMAALASRLAHERDRANREASAARANAATLGAMLAHRQPDNGRGLDDPAAVAAMLEETVRTWSGAPDEEVELLRSAGASLYGAGAFESSLRYLEKAVEIEKTISADWEARSTMMMYAEICQRAGRLEEAERLFRRHLEALKTLTRPIPARTMGYAEEDLGCALRALGRLDEAEALVRSAKIRYETDTFPEPRLLASIHDSLGNLALARGDLARAEAEHRDALELRVSEADPPSTAYLQSLEGIGVVLLRRGKLDEAESFLKRAHDGRRLRLGAQHPDTQATVVALGELEAARGKIDAARSYLEQATSIFERGLPHGHPTVTSLRKAIAEGGIVAAAR